MAAIYRFPYEASTDYLGTATFRPIEIDPVVLGTFDLDRFSVLTSAASNFTSNIFGLDDEQETQVQNELAQAALQSPDPAGSRGPLLKRSSRPSADTRVTLYLPQQIQVNDIAEYAEVELGVIGAAAEGALRQGRTVGQAVGASIIAATSSITDAINGQLGEQAATLAATRAIRALVPNQQIENGVTSAARVTINPNKRTLFTGVGLRQFTFMFKMVATSPREAQEIDNIVQFFRAEMYPTVVEGTAGVGFNFPRPIQIDLRYNDMQVAQKIKPVYIRGVNTTYNPSTMGFHIDGKASEVELTINFSEPEAMTRKDIEEGF